MSIFEEVLKRIDKAQIEIFLLLTIDRHVLKNNFSR